MRLKATQIKQFYRYRGSEQKTGPAGRQKNTPHHSPVPSPPPPPPPRGTVASVLYCPALHHFHLPPRVFSSRLPLSLSSPPPRHRASLPFVPVAFRIKAHLLSFPATITIKRACSHRLSLYLPVASYQQQQVHSPHSSPTRRVQLAKQRRGREREVGF